MILECAVFCVVLVAFKRHMFVGSLTTLRFLLHPCLCFFFKKKFNVCRSSFGLRDSISLDVFAAQHSYQTFFFFMFSVACTSLWFWGAFSVVSWDGLLTWFCPSAGRQGRGGHRSALRFGRFSVAGKPCRVGHLETFVYQGGRCMKG